MKTTLLSIVVAGLVMGCAAADAKIDPGGPETARRGEEADMETMMSSSTLSVSIA